MIVHKCELCKEEVETYIEIQLRGPYVWKSFEICLKCSKSMISDELWTQLMKTLEEQRRGGKLV